MIKIENVVLPSTKQWAAVIRGMRNPLNSWELSDSRECSWHGYLECGTMCTKCKQIPDEAPFIIGSGDFDLMKKLRNAGTEHRKFMRMIPVYLDIVAPLYWWKEFDTYKVGTVVNSCSTMHKIQAKEFTVDDFSTEHLSEMNIAVLEDTIIALNEAREWYVKYSKMDKSIDDRKNIWWQMIQLLPSSYNQRRTVMLNYEVLATMYHQRKNHKLDEWREFCSWIETLPYSELIVGKKEE